MNDQPFLVLLLSNLGMPIFDLLLHSCSISLGILEGAVRLRGEKEFLEGYTSQATM